MTLALLVPEIQRGGGPRSPPPVTDWPKKPSLNRVKISWRVSTSLKARQFGHIQWDSLKNKNRWNIHIQNTPLNIQTRQRRGRRDWNVSREAGAPNHRYPLNALKTLFRLSRVLSNPKRRYKSCICSVVRNHLGPQYYFPENFRCNFTFYESENFSDSSLHHIFNLKIIFRFPFPTKNRLTWVLKCEKLNFKKS